MLKQTCNNLYIAKKQEETDEKVGLFLGAKTGRIFVCKSSVNIKKDGA